MRHGISARKKPSNGVLILVFVQNHKIRIQTGYGLEGALPDALCNRIIRETMAPAFRAGDYSGGLSAGITAVMQATKGEYQGIGQKAQRHANLLDVLFSPFGLFLLVMFVLLISNRDGVMPVASVREQRRRLVSSWVAEAGAEAPGEGVDLVVVAEGVDSPAVAGIAAGGGASGGW